MISVVCEARTNRHDLVVYSDTQPRRYCVERLPAPGMNPVPFSKRLLQRGYTPKLQAPSTVPHNITVERMSLHDWKLEQACDTRMAKQEPKWVALVEETESHRIEDFYRKTGSIPRTVLWGYAVICKSNEHVTVVRLKHQTTREHREEALAVARSYAQPVARLALRKGYAPDKGAAERHMRRKLDKMQRQTDALVGDPELLPLIVALRVGREMKRKVTVHHEDGHTRQASIWGDLTELGMSLRRQGYTARLQ